MVLNKLHRSSRSLTLQDFKEASKGYKVGPKGKATLLAGFKRSAIESANIFGLFIKDERNAKYFLDKANVAFFNNSLDEPLFKYNFSLH